MTIAMHCHGAYSGAMMAAALHEHGCTGFGVDLPRHVPSVRSHDM